MERARLILQVPGLSTCPPPQGVNLYDFLQCPPGDQYYKLSTAANTDTCVHQETPCPADNECFCAPCRVLPANRFLIRASPDAFSKAIYNDTYILSFRDQAPLFQTNLGNSKICEKLGICQVLEVGQNLTVIFSNLLPDSLSPGLPSVDTVEISTGSALASTFENFTQSDNLTWYYTTPLRTSDVMVIQIRVNGIDINNSPFVVDVIPPPDTSGNGPSRAAILGLSIGIPLGIFFLLVVLLLLILAGLKRWDTNRFFIKPNEINLESSEVKGLGLVGLMNGSVRVHLHPVVRRKAPVFSERRKIATNQSLGGMASSAYEVEEPKTLSNNALPSTPETPMAKPAPVKDTTALTRASVARQIADIISICKRGRHPALGYCYGYTYFYPPSVKDDPLLCLVEEYSDYGSLADLIDNRAITLEVRLHYVALNLGLSASHVNKSNDVCCFLYRSPNSALLREHLFIT